MFGNSFIPEMLILGGGSGHLIGNFAPSLFILGSNHLKGTTLLKDLDPLLLKDLDPQTLGEISGISPQEHI